MRLERTVGDFRDHVLAGRVGSKGIFGKRVRVNAPQYNIIGQSPDSIAIDVNRNNARASGICERYVNREILATLTVSNLRAI